MYMYVWPSLIENKLNFQTIPFIETNISKQYQHFYTPTSFIFYIHLFYVLKKCTRSDVIRKSELLYSIAYSVSQLAKTCFVTSLAPKIELVSPTYRSLCARTWRKFLPSFMLDPLAFAICPYLKGPKSAFLNINLTYRKCNIRYASRECQQIFAWSYDNGSRMFSARQSNSLYAEKRHIHISFEKSTWSVS